MARKLFLSLSAFLGCAVLIAISDSRPLNAAGADVKSVIVANGSTNPIPAQVVGTTSVAGTVNIGNNSPIAVQNVGTTTVSGAITVNNPANAPLPTRATDNPDLRPFQRFSNQIGQAGPQSLLAFTVPNDARLVIEQVSATCFVPSANQVISLGGFRLGVNGGGSGEYELPVQQGLSNTQVISNLTLKTYADPGTEVFLHISGQFPSSSSCGASIAGHLVNPL